MQTTYQSLYNEIANNLATEAKLDVSCEDAVAAFIREHHDRIDEMVRNILPRQIARDTEFDRIYREQQDAHYETIMRQYQLEDSERGDQYAGPDALACVPEDDADLPY